MDPKEPVLCEVQSYSESRYWSSASDSASCGMWPSKCCTKSTTGFPWQRFADVWSEQHMISIKVVLRYMLYGPNCDQPLSRSRHLIFLSFWRLAVDAIAAMNRHTVPLRQPASEPCRGCWSRSRQITTHIAWYDLRSLARMADSWCKDFALGNYVDNSCKGVDSNEDRDAFSWDYGEHLH